MLNFFWKFEIYTHTHTQKEEIGEKKTQRIRYRYRHEYQKSTWIVDPYLTKCKDSDPLLEDLIRTNLLQNTQNQYTKSTCHNLLIELYKKL